VNNVKPGDRVWVRHPSELVERKVGTIVAAKKTPQGVRYLVEGRLTWRKSPMDTTQDTARTRS